MGQRTITVVGARGGHGATTVAAALAVYAAGHVPTQLVAADTDTAAALLGVPAPCGPESVQVTPTLTLAEHADDEAEVVVVDAGTAAQVGTGGPEAGECYAVVRGPCYLGLHTLIARPGLRLTGVVIVAEPGRSLAARDVEDVLGVPVVATVHCTPTVARAVDAGLFVGRLHRLRDLKALRALVSPRPTPADLAPWA